MTYSKSFGLWTMNKLSELGTQDMIHSKFSLFELSNTYWMMKGKRVLWSEFILSEI
jgi:hypothetical protein